MSDTSALTPGPAGTPSRGGAPTGGPPLTGQHIGEASRAVTAVLDRLLAETGVDFLGWVALNGIAVWGPTAVRDQVVTRLAVALHTDEAPIRATFDQLLWAGLSSPAEADEAPEAGETGASASASGEVPARFIRLTSAGLALHQRVQQLIGRVTAELYDGIPRDDLETTRRVLAEVTVRANAHLAGTAAG